MNEEIIKAFDAKLEHESEGLSAWEQLVALEYFLEGANEGLKQERERCAKICDAKFELRKEGGFPREASTARKLAEEIRKGGQI